MKRDIEKRKTIFFIAFISLSFFLIYFLNSGFNGNITGNAVTENKCISCNQGGLGKNCMQICMEAGYQNAWGYSLTSCGGSMGLPSICDNQNIYSCYCTRTITCENPCEQSDLFRCSGEMKQYCDYNVTSQCYHWMNYENCTKLGDICTDDADVMCYPPTGYCGTVRNKILNELNETNKGLCNQSILTQGTFKSNLTGWSWNCSDEQCYATKMTFCAQRGYTCGEITSNKNMTLSCAAMNMEWVGNVTLDNSCNSSQIQGCCKYCTYGLNETSGKCKEKTVWDNSYSVSNSNFEKGYSKKLDTLERLKFEVDDEDHYVGILKMTTKNITIEVASDPQIETIAIGKSKSFDVDDDDEYDLKITLNAIKSGLANITLKSLLSTEDECEENDGICKEDCSSGESEEDYECEDDDEICCVEFENECEENNGICKSSCSSDEEIENYDCDTSSELCCVEVEEPLYTCDYSCKTSCLSDEEKKTGTCESGKTCCGEITEELGEDNENLWIYILIITGVLVLFVGIIIYFYWRKTRQQ